MNTDKKPQTVFCICKDEDAQAFLYYTPDYKPGSMIKRLAIPVKEHESVYIHTPEELQALKGESVKELTDVLNQLFNRDAGCPQCDYGVLRKEDDEHWDNCIWNNARKVYEKYVSKPC